MWFPVSDHASDGDHIYQYDMVTRSTQTGYEGLCVRAPNAVATDVVFVGVALAHADSGSANTYLNRVPVCIDPAAIYPVQCDDATPTNIASRFLGFGVAVPASYLGDGEHSDMELDGDSGSESAGQWILLDIITGPQQGGGTLPTWGTTNTELLVKPNAAQMATWMT